VGSGRCPSQPPSVRFSKKLLIKARLKANSNQNHGKPKYKYLLGGYAFCGACGKLLIGCPEMRRGILYRYYRHCKDTYKQCPLSPKPQVPVEKWDRIVISQLFDLLGNPAAIKRAVKDTIPNHDMEVKRRDKLMKELGGIKAGIDRVIGMVAKGIVSAEEASTQLNILRERQSLLKVEVSRLDEALASIPSDEQMQAYIERIEGFAGKPDALYVMDEAGNEYEGGNSVSTWLNMTWEDQRAMVEAVFKDATVGGKPAGVYFAPLPGGKPRQPKGWSFKLLGHLDFESCWVHDPQSTPKINKDAGRDHWSRVSGALLSGGGMRTGQVIGSTDATAAETKQQPIPYRDVLATVYHNLGIDPNGMVYDVSGRPTPILPSENRPIERVY
jgi:hypothetical protein